MKCLSLFFTIIFAAGFLFAGVEARAEISIGTTVENFTLPDTNNQNQSFNDLKGEKGAVVVFLSAQCPVVKAYNDRINQLAVDYAAKGINFIGINSNSTESLEWVKSHAEANYKFPMLIDKGNVLADKFGASVTPEMYYFNEKNVLVYHGAIDNDKSGANIGSHYLKDAFDLTLAGKAVGKATALAIGCTIKRAAKTQ